MVKAKKMGLRKETLRNLDVIPTEGDKEVCTFRGTGCTTSDCTGACTAC